mmetsp:Transcript_10949/g.24879  ORF Transcript_10949/g.24879 Transcript_10949/m.24879 type:complete len:121 (+) Transcript_10949:353-715(+)
MASTPLCSCLLCEGAEAPVKLQYELTEDDLLHLLAVATTARQAAKPNGEEESCKPAWVCSAMIKLPLTGTVAVVEARLWSVVVRQFALSAPAEASIPAWRVTPAGADLQPAPAPRFSNKT